MRISDWSSDVCSSDLLAAVVDGVEDFADGNGRHGMLPDQLQPLLILRRRRIFNPEQAVGLEALAETCRLDGREPMMQVVKEMEAEAVIFEQRVEQLRREVEILFRRHDLFVRQALSGRSRTEGIRSEIQ